MHESYDPTNPDSPDYCRKCADHSNLDQFERLLRSNRFSNVATDPLDSRRARAPKPDLILRYSALYIAIYITVQPITVGILTVMSR